MAHLIPTYTKYTTSVTIRQSCSGPANNFTLRQSSALSNGYEMSICRERCRICPLAGLLQCIEWRKRALEAFRVARPPYLCPVSFQSLRSTPHTISIARFRGCPRYGDEENLPTSSRASTRKALHTRPPGAAPASSFAIDTMYEASVLYCTKTAFSSEELP